MRQYSVDSEVELLIDRAKHEILTAELLNKFSVDSTLKENLNIPSDTTFYSAIIGHAYYAIFYSARAYLISKKIKVPEQGQHNAVYYMFKKFVKSGELDRELLVAYEEVKVKADVLLAILEDEEEKRTQYTYKTFPQANKEPAEESINNAEFFVSHVKSMLESQSSKNKEQKPK